MENVRVNIEPGKKKDGGKATLILNGDLSYKNSDSIKKEIISVVEQYNNIELQLENVEELDITCIQIFYSLKNTFSKAGKKITFKTSLPENLKAIIMNSGFNEIF
ncbi:unnamed protein product [marine sediment metagenome]|uniref:STAS domain-containing protein n=1 Tax=marine sediment metagenome TaxID=412755 RepID=X1IKQ1_9ZZZZ